MADRYWVGGTGTWNTTSTTNWAATSGGASGASAPTSSDNVFFDQSGTYTVTGDGGTCNNLTVSAGTVTFTNPSGSIVIGALNIYGSLSLSANTDMFGGDVNERIIRLLATTSGKTLSGASGARIRSARFDGVGGVWTLTGDLSMVGDLDLRAGTINLSSYTLTVGEDFFTSQATAKAVDFGTGVLSIASDFYISSTLPTISGSGIIRFTGAATKTFGGSGIQTYPTLDQAGSGALTITGSNGFADITNTYKATGATTVKFTGGTTNTFAAFNLSGEVGRVCTLTSTTTTQAILIKPGAWNVGANSTDSGNNTGLTFAAGGGIDYLDISYIRGAEAGGANFLAFF